MQTSDDRDLPPRAMYATSFASDGGRVTSARSSMRRMAALVHDEPVLSIPEVMAHLPDFERRQFSPSLAPLGVKVPTNPRFHAIVRADSGIPVGLVSPEYSLVQHTDVLGAVHDALDTLGVTADRLLVHLSPLGEQLFASLTVPGLVSFRPHDGHPVVPRLTISNSVDGGSALRVRLGFLRLVCRNGLIAEVRTGITRRHAAGLTIGAVREVVGAEIAQVGEAQRQLAALEAEPIGLHELAVWADGPLRDAWGAQAATRVFHVASRGVDVDLVSTFDSAPPSGKRVRDRGHAPGSAAPARNRYALLQALTFVASRSENLVQRWRWEAQAMELVKAAA